MKVVLGPGPTPAQLVRRVADWDGLVALVGDWADGAALLTADPAARATSFDDLASAGATEPDDVVAGGWFGHVDFDGRPRLAYYDHVVRLVGDSWQFEALAETPRTVARLAAWRAALAAGESPPGPGWRVGEFTGPEAAGHLAAVERAVELIRAGELYQVNVCTRLAASFAGSSAELFATAVEELQPRYGGYVAGRIVSLSPELFLHRRGRQVRSGPIKGTLPRGPAGNDAALRRSTKDVAENVMIVDLVRNDLGRVSEVGTVWAGPLLDVEPHPGVWHLVSTVRGELRTDATDADLLRATFPPGSVTGAPKERALAAIAELEATPRGAYTGAVGFVSPRWGTQFNVAIRTFEVADGEIALGVGGGVTADSVPMLEWRECLHKAAPLVAVAGGAVAAPPEPAAPLLAGGLLETILGRDGRPVRLADHLARLDRSGRELYGTGRPADLDEQVRAAARTIPGGRAVLRVVLDPSGAAVVTAAPLGPPPAGSDLVTVARPAGLWRHKWADRRWATVGLHVAVDGTVLETDRGNVFLIEPDGTLVTPPLRDDLLPGVTRRAVLDHARDTGRPTRLRPFDREELLRRPAFWTSSLSGVVPIRSVDGVPLPRADVTTATLAAAILGGGRAFR